MVKPQGASGKSHISRCEAVENTCVQIFLFRGATGVVILWNTAIKQHARLCYMTESRYRWARMSACAERSCVCSMLALYPVRAGSTNGQFVRSSPSSVGISGALASPTVFLPCLFLGAMCERWSHLAPPGRIAFHGATVGCLVPRVIRDYHEIGLILKCSDVRLKTRALRSCTR